MADKDKSHEATSREHHSSYSNIKIATFINIGFTIIEFVGGALTNSLSIIADALHDLGDSMVLLSSWKVEHLSLKKPDWRRTFGYRRMSLLAAFLNAVIMVGGSLTILFQVIGRLISPQPVNGQGMVVIAVIGIVANTIGSLQLKKGGTLHEKMLSWHLLEDVFGWLGLLIGGLIIYFTNFYILDPLLTIVFTAFVLWNVWRNSRELFNVFLEGVPSDISLPEITAEIEKIPGIVKLYDIHLWSLDGKHHIASLKAKIDARKIQDFDRTEKTIKEILAKHHITHSTVELSNGGPLAKKEQEQEFLKKQF